MGRQFSTNPLVRGNASGALELVPKQQLDAAISGLNAAGVGAMRRLTPTATKTTNYNAADGDLVPVDNSSAVTVTLPTATAGAMIGVTKITNTDINKVTIAKQAGDTWLNGTPTPLLIQGDTMLFYGYVGGWIALSTQTRPKQFSPVTLTPTTGNVTIDAGLGNSFLLIATGNCTLLAPSNPVGGQVIEVEFQASGGARTLSLTTTASAGNFKFGTDITALTSTPSGTTDLVQFRYSSNLSRWLPTGYIKGF
jgi:hypothetical protein